MKLNSAGAARALARSKAGRELPLILFLLSLLGGSAWFTWRLLASLDLVSLIHTFQDDAFYYFQIARNLAAGQFSTFDGGITRTNGYHPAWMLMVTPFYWLFDAESALVAIKAFEFGLIAGGVALVVVAARLARLPWLLLIATLPLLAQHQGLVLGMEAAAGLFALGALFLALTGFARRPARWKWPLAGIAFALPWVRLEYLAVSLAATGALCLLELAGESGGPARRRKSLSAALRERAGALPSLAAFAPLVAAASSALAYFAYNRAVFGGAVPVSGAVKQMLSRYEWNREGGYSFARNFQELLRIEAFNDELLAALEICVYFLLLWWIGRGRRNRDDRFALAFLAGAFALAAGHLAAFGHALLDLHPFYASSPWYFVPARLLMALATPVRCFVAIGLIRRFVAPGSPRLAGQLVLGVIAVGLGIQFFAAGGAEALAQRAAPRPARTVERAVERVAELRPGAYNFQIGYCYMGSQILNRVLPAGSVVGAGNAGVLAYFSRFPVVNLDGLVNSYEYLDARKAAGGSFVQALEREDLLERYGITHFADLWGHRPPLPAGADPWFEGAWHESAQARASFRILAMRPEASAAASNGEAMHFWKGMAPHWDYQEGGTSVFVERRTVQAFAEDCAPSGVRDERFLFSWRSEAGEAASVTWQPWADANRNSLGYCAAAYILPQGATGPIGIERVPSNPASEAQRAP